MRFHFIAVSLLGGALLASAAANAQLTYQIGSTTLLIDEVVDSSRVNIPWEILWGPDDRLWMTDGPLITRWDPVTDVIDTLIDRGYGNGLGMALHPDFPNTPIIMAVFDTATYYGGGNWCEVSRFDYDAVNDTVVAEEVLFAYYHAGEHGGGRVLFDTTGNVLITTADYYFNGPDTLFSPVGKTLRFATDGSVPPGNPRPDHTWTWGDRNPQGLAMLPNGAVVNSEHGQLWEGNEVNLLQGNEDHGYPYYDGTSCLVFPDTCNSATYTYVPPISTFTHPPSGCEFYTSAAIPEMQDKLITCILWHRGLMLFGFNDELDTVLTEEYLQGGAFDFMARNRDIAIRPDGSFYLITNDRQNARIRWVRADGSTTLHDAPLSHDALRAWPNPAQDKLFVDAPGAGWIQVIDAQGRSVACPTARMGDRFFLDVADLHAGVYIVRTDDVRTVRFMKR